MRKFIDRISRQSPYNQGYDPHGEAGLERDDIAQIRPPLTPSGLRPPPPFSKNMKMGEGGGVATTPLPLKWHVFRHSCPNLWRWITKKLC